MATRLPYDKSAYRAALLAAALAGLLPGCVHEEEVTMRPQYAFPQHLDSLCGREVKLLVSNRGEFVTANRTSPGNALLLSVQLSAAELATQRLITHLELEVSPDRGVTVYAYDSSGRWLLSDTPSEQLHCTDGGELLMDYPPNSFYFWASVGKKERVLALWSNDNGDVVIQSRWREEHTGVVSGTVTGDAWARFRAAELAPTAGTGRAEPPSSPATGVTACADLSGHYLPEAEVVYNDGSLDHRQATDQFFREEIVGEHPLNQGEASPTELRIEQEQGAGISLHLYDDQNLLGTRTLPAGSLNCVDGRWLFKGDKTMHSAWLLFAASGGVHWEDLTLWRDQTGALLVEGRHTQRALLMLIPFGGTQTLFMAFPENEKSGEKGQNPP